VVAVFAGSGTTLVAAGNLGRRWIGIDNSRAAISAIVNRLRFGSQPMGDFGAKKRTPAVDNHLELFSSRTEVEQKRVTNGTAEDFCLYRAADAMGFESHPDNVFALKDKPTKRKFAKQLKEVVYKISRK